MTIEFHSKNKFKEVFCVHVFATSILKGTQKCVNIKPQNPTPIHWATKCVWDMNHGDIEMSHPIQMKKKLKYTHHCSLN